MKIEDGNVDIIQKLRVELDRIARGEEDNHFLLQILLQEREEEQEPVLAGTDNITLRRSKEDLGTCNDIRLWLRL